MLGSFVGFWTSLRPISYFTALYCNFDLYQIHSTEPISDVSDSDVCLPTIAVTG